MNDIFVLYTSNNWDKFFIIDAHMSDFVRQHYWLVDDKGAINRREKGKKIYLSRELVKTDLLVDHKNRLPFDNRLCNLRPATVAQNNYNNSKYGGTSSEYLGVSKYCGDKKWHASINKDKKKFHIGSFNSEIEAAEAYDKIAKEIYGEFASLNFP